MFFRLLITLSKIILYKLCYPLIFIRTLFMNNTINIWQVIITLFIAVMGFLIQLYISYKKQGTD